MPNAEQLPQPKQTPSLPARAAERSGANEQPANEQPANEQPQAKPRAKEDGSIFDALEDPFGDDGVDEGTPFDETTPTDARPRRSYQPLFQRDGASLPRRSNPATQMGAGGTGRGAIGSGLRPVDNNVPLRPVSHEAPVELPPMSRTRVLAPYRPARSQ
jgi:hypothetical protein